jgi:hypothetical protein
MIQFIKMRRLTLHKYPRSSRYVNLRCLYKTNLKFEAIIREYEPYLSSQFVEFERFCLRKCTQPRRERASVYI